MKNLCFISQILLIVGGINWGLYGLMGGMDLVQMIFGSVPMLATIVYALVGASGIYALTQLKGMSSCSSGSAS